MAGMNFSNVEAVSSVAGGTLMTVLVCAGIFLAVLTVLMPVVVYCIYTELQRLRKLTERVEWYLKKGHEREEAAKEARRY